MMQDHRDPDIQALFANADRDLAEDLFTAKVIGQAEVANHRTIIRRVGIGVLIGLVAIPVQEAAVPIAQLILTPVVAIDSQLPAQILAPINSVGAALSAVLFMIRAAHRRLFA